MNRLTDAEMLEIARARQAFAAQIEEDAEYEGLAVRTVRYRFGVVGRRPGKKRSATSGCQGERRKHHGRLSPMVAPCLATNDNPVVIPPMPVCGLTKKGKPYKQSIAVKGMHVKAAKKVQVS